MAEIISLGALEITFLQSRETTGSSLDLFEMPPPWRAHASAILSRDLG